MVGVDDKFGVAVRGGHIDRGGFSGMGGYWGSEGAGSQTDNSQ